MEPPFDVFEESPQNRRALPPVRVEKMFEDIQSKLPGAPEFILCLLPDRKNCDIYGLLRFTFKHNCYTFSNLDLGFAVCCLTVLNDSSGPWKRKNLADYGIVTQCMAPTRVNDQYLSNCLLKINAKVGYFVDHVTELIVIFNHST